MNQDWALITYEALQKGWEGILGKFLGIIPELLLATFLFLIGWFISCGIGKLVSEVLKKLKFNQVFESGGWKESLEKAEITVDPAEFIGAIFKWVLAIVSLSIAVEILGLEQFSVFLTKILGYLPNVIVAVLIFAVTVVAADIIEKVIRAGVGGIKVGYARLAGTIAKWAIWVFAIFAILIQLGIAQSLLLVLFQGLVALMVIAGGLAFGLGGKDVAAELLQDLKGRFKKD